MVSRRYVLGGLLAGLAAPAFAEGLAVSPRPLPRPSGKPTATGSGPTAGALIEAAGLGGVVGYAIADARSGKLLEAMGESQAPRFTPWNGLAAAIALSRRSC
jgi:serine-type D-Ala-D-Ala carboxypeptidase/endopeptidase (penicillin-binding protein 4)